MRSSLTGWLLAVGLCTGCSKATPSKAAEFTSFQPFTCAAGLSAETPEKQVAQRGRELRLAKEASYVAVYRRMAERAVRLAELGAACAGSTDAAACRKQLDERVKSLATCPPNPPCEGVFAVVERNGQWSQASSERELVELLAPIDSAEEAWLVAQAHLGIPASLCGDAGTSAFRQAAAGYELRYPYASGPCPEHSAEISAATISVNRSGAVQVLKREVTEPQQHPCP